MKLGSFLPSVDIHSGFQNFMKLYVQDHVLIGLLGIGLILSAAACQPSENTTILPTLAILPTLTTATPSTVAATQFVQVSQPTVTVAPVATSTVASPNLVQTLVNNATAVPITTVDSVFQTSVATSAIDQLTQANIPEKLNIGDLIAVTGTLTVSTNDPKLATLTDKSNHTIAVLIDPFTADQANNHSVSIEGIIVKTDVNHGNIAIEIKSIKIN